MRIKRNKKDKKRQITFNMLPVFLAMLTHRDAMIKNVFEYIKNIVLLMVYTYYYKC